jgi:hypothetical protein
MVWLGRPASIDNATFRNNVNYDFSAGIYLAHDQPQAIRDGVFEGNDGADLDGAAIYVGAPGTVTTERCTFRGNVADGSGSAVYVFEGAYTDAGSVFEDNRASFESVFSSAVGIGRDASGTFVNTVFRRNAPYGVALLGDGTFIDVAFGSGDDINRDGDVRDRDFVVHTLRGNANGSCTAGTCSFDP